MKPNRPHGLYSRTTYSGQFRARDRSHGLEDRLLKSSSGDCKGICLRTTKIVATVGMQIGKMYLRCVTVGMQIGKLYLRCDTSQVRSPVLSYRLLWHDTILAVAHTYLQLPHTPYAYVIIFLISCQ
jgi:hypothetical protein